MPRTTTNYAANAKSDAKEMAENFIDEIVEMIFETGVASQDMNNDYPNGDAYHHESHIDKWYDLQDACAILDQLSEHEETDSGLWDGQDMKKALATCAAFTYGNAVTSEWFDLIKTINADDELPDICAKIGPAEDADEDTDPIKAEIKARIEAVIEAY